MSATSSKDFWLDSGGRFIVSNGMGMTIQGALPVGDHWQVAYADAGEHTNNPVDTDHGKYPQNLFRLITTSTWTNVSQKLVFQIAKLHTTATTNRDYYSGVSLYSRYVGDGQTLYIASLRQDGTAAVKKKYHGRYIFLGQTRIFPNDRPYDRESNPNVIPVKTWIGLKTVTMNKSGKVRIEVFVDKANTGTWQSVLTVVDKPEGNIPVLSEGAYCGIRTDYADIVFKDYEAEEQNSIASSENRPLSPTSR